MKGKTFIYLSTSSALLLMMLAAKGNPSKQPHSSAKPTTLNILNKTAHPNSASSHTQVAKPTATSIAQQLTRDNTPHTSSQAWETQTANLVSSAAQAEQNGENPSQVLEEQAKSDAVGLVNGAIAGTINQVLNRYGHAAVNIGIDEHGHLQDASGTFLYPLYNTPAWLIFTQMSLHRDTNNQWTGNIGVGERYFTKNWMLGSNIFYDRNLTAQQQRFGLGLEYWRNDFKLAANSYFRLSDQWKDSDLIEDYLARPANGWDVDMQAWLPMLPQLGGELKYEEYYGDQVGLAGDDLTDLAKDPHRLTVGINYTPIPLIKVGLAIQSSSEHHHDLQLNVTLNLMFGESLAAQLDPSSVASMRSLMGQRYDFVNRNNNIVLEYKKKQLIRLTDIASISSYAGAIMPLNVAIQSKYPIKSGVDGSQVNWSGVIADRVSHVGQNYQITLPNYNPDGNNTYKLVGQAADVQGNLSNEAVTLVNVTGTGIDLNKSELEVDKPQIMPAKAGFDVSIVTLKLRHSDDSPVTGIASQLSLAPNQWVPDPNVQANSGNHPPVISSFKEQLDTQGQPNGNYIATIDASSSNTELGTQTVIPDYHSTSLIGGKVEQKQVQVVSNIDHLSIELKLMPHQSQYVDYPSDPAASNSNKVQLEAILTPTNSNKKLSATLLKDNLSSYIKLNQTIQRDYETSSKAVPSYRVQPESSKGPYYYLITLTSEPDIGGKDTITASLTTDNVNQQGKRSTQLSSSTPSNPVNVVYDPIDYAKTTLTADYPCVTFISSSVGTAMQPMVTQCANPNGSGSEKIPEVVHLGLKDYSGNTILKEDAPGLSIQVGKNTVESSALSDNKDNKSIDFDLTQALAGTPLPSSVTIQPSYQDPITPDKHQLTALSINVNQQHFNQLTVSLTQNNNQPLLQNKWDAIPYAFIGTPINVDAKINAPLSTPLSESFSLNDAQMKAQTSSWKTDNSGQYKGLLQQTAPVAGESTLEVSAPYVAAKPTSFAMMPQLAVKIDNSITHYQGSDHVLVTVKAENYQGKTLPLNATLSLNDSTATPVCEYSADKAGKTPLSEVNGIPVVPLTNGEATFYVSTSQSNSCSVVTGYTLSVNAGKGSDTVHSSAQNIPFVEQSLSKGTLNLSRHDILADGSDSSTLSFSMTDAKGQPVNDYYVVVSAPELDVKTTAMAVTNGVFTTPITSDVAHFNDSVTLTAYANQQDYQTKKPPIAGPLVQTINAHAYITGFKFGMDANASNGAQADGKDLDIGYITLADKRGDKQLPYENIVVTADKALIGSRILTSNGTTQVEVPFSSKQFNIATGFPVEIQSATRVGDNIVPIASIPEDKNIPVDESSKTLDYRYIGYMTVIDGPTPGTAGSLTKPAIAHVNVQDADGNNVNDMDTRIVASPMTQMGTALPQPAKGVLFHHNMPTSMTIGDNPINWKPYEGSKNMEVTVTATDPGKYYVTYVNAVCLLSDTSCAYGDPNQYKQVPDPTGFIINFYGNSKNGIPKLVSVNKVDIAADGKDASVVTVEAVDNKGGIIPNALINVTRSDTGETIPVATNSKGIGIVPFTSKDAAVVNITATYEGVYNSASQLKALEQQAKSSLQDKKSTPLTTLYFVPYIASMRADGEDNTKPNVDNKLADNQQFYTVQLKLTTADPKQTSYPILRIPVSNKIGTIEQNGKTVKSVQTNASGEATFEVFSLMPGPDTINATSVGQYSRSLNRFFDSPYIVSGTVTVNNSKASGSLNLSSLPNDDKISLNITDLNGKPVTASSINVPLFFNYDKKLTPIEQYVNNQENMVTFKNGFAEISFTSQTYTGYDYKQIIANILNIYQHPTPAKPLPVGSYELYYDTTVVNLNTPNTMVFPYAGDTPAYSLTYDGDKGFPSSVVQGGIFLLSYRINNNPTYKNFSGYDKTWFPQGTVPWISIVPDVEFDNTYIAIKFNSQLSPMPSLKQMQQGVTIMRSNDTGNLYNYSMPKIKDVVKLLYNVPTPPAFSGHRSKSDYYKWHAKLEQMCQSLGNDYYMMPSTYSSAPVNYGFYNNSLHMGTLGQGMTINEWGEFWRGNYNLLIDDAYLVAVGHYYPLYMTGGSKFVVAHDKVNDYPFIIGCTDYLLK